MTKWLIAGAVVATGFAFTAGCWVGWKTTLSVIDAVTERMKRNDSGNSGA